ncbi:hypothetical protein BH09SUM1_BH09SUM1_27160 [soil metagenome]
MPQREAFSIRPLPTAGDMLIDALFNRPIAILGMIGLILGMFVLPPKGVHLQTCSMRKMTGLPCPGCGLTRSVTSIFHGKAKAAWELNPFGYGFAAFFVAVAPLAFLPTRKLNAAREYARRFRNPIGLFVIVFMALFILHGLIRIGLVMGHSSYYEWWNQGDVPPALIENGL